VTGVRLRFRGTPVVNHDWSKQVVKRFHCFADRINTGNVDDDDDDDNCYTEYNVAAYHVETACVLRKCSRLSVGVNPFISK